MSNGLELLLAFLVAYWVIRGLMKRGRGEH